MNKPKFDLKKPHNLLATWFGSGLINPAPGTWGSLAALPFGVALFHFCGLAGLAIGIIAVTLIGYWAADQFEKETGIHDGKMVVIDEVAGQWIALLPAFYFFGPSLIMIALSFAFFRFFDILKPWPVSYFDQKIENAIGVMGDDVVAGIYAALCITGLFYAGFG